MANYNETRKMVEEMLQKEQYAQQSSTIVSRTFQTDEDLLNQIGLSVQRR